MKRRGTILTLLFFLLLSGFGSPDLINESDIYTELRTSMVEKQILARGVSDIRILEVMGTVPRHLFVSEEYIQQSYADHPLPIGYGQTISQPYIVAFMTEILSVESGDRILEIGTGSGYQAAVLSMLTDHVYTMEIIDELALEAEKRLAELGFDSIEIKKGDGYFGWPEKAPFDKIIVTAAAGHVPPDLIEQLNPGGMILIPIGRPFSVQYLTVIRKDLQGIMSAERILPVRFVPFTGQAER